MVNAVSITRLLHILQQQKKKKEKKKKGETKKRIQEKGVS